MFFSVIFHVWRYITCLYFSHVKISCFRANAYSAFKWWLYNILINSILISMDSWNKLLTNRHTTLSVWNYQWFSPAQFFCLDTSTIYEFWSLNSNYLGMCIYDNVLVFEWCFPILRLNIFKNCFLTNATIVETFR